MKAALLSLALLGGQPFMQVSDRVPQFDVEALCKQTVDVDKAMGLAEAQSLSDCMRDQMTAQRQLVTAWGTAPGAVRDRCEAEATLVGIASYVDLLSCMQMADLATSATAAPLRGASKNRKAK